MVKSSDLFLTDNLEGVGLSPLPPPASEEVLGENREYGAEPAPVVMKADVPWCSRRGAMSEEDRVLKSVMGTN